MASIAPWNRPFNMAVTKIVPALITGRSVVYTPAPDISGEPLFAHRNPSAPWPGHRGPRRRPARRRRLPGGTHAGSPSSSWNGRTGVWLLLLRIT
ncbi:aldehyde dehydrogenase family protein [Nonomuraea sp. CA-143628]|uniref:aldehyde dehydrogenase family protein n=1 Tax=Nonomuraea sp. CA-143628 TaxID=3239997 RepID=UPI003D8C61B5